MDVGGFDFTKIFENWYISFKTFLNTQLMQLKTGVKWAYMRQIDLKIFVICAKTNMPTSFCHQKVPKRFSLSPTHISASDVTTFVRDQPRSRFLEWDCNGLISFSVRFCVCLPLYWKVCIGFPLHGGRLILRFSCCCLSQAGLPQPPPSG